MNDSAHITRVTRAEAIGLAASVLWLVAAAVVVLGFGLAQSGGLVQFVMTLMAIFLPVAMIWIAMAASRSARIMRDEAARLHAAIDGMRDIVLADRRDRAAGGLKPELEEALRDIAKSLKSIERAPDQHQAVRAAAPTVVTAPAPGPDAQPALQLGTPSDEISTPLAHADLIRALNFPDTAEDKAGFAALRLALRHRTPAKLIQAAQDLLTLLSEDGIYMDDLRPDLARPDYWRRFAQGARGPEMAALGGVRDRSSLALAAGRMREDAIFRDAVHHFLRRFDQLLFKLEPDMTDEELIQLAETRTARAFMLMGRVTGAFD